MKRYLHLAVILLLTACISLGEVKNLNREESGIVAVGPIKPLDSGNGAYLTIEQSRPVFLSFKEVRDKTIVIGAFAQGTSIDTYVGGPGIFLPQLDSGAYSIVFRNPDGTLIPLGDVFYSKGGD